MAGRAKGEKRLQAAVGARIREAREAAGLTMARVAERSGIELRRYKRLEAGTTNPTVRTLQRVALVLGRDFWSVLGAAPAKSTFAGTSWCAEDVLAHAPNLSEEQAETFLQENEKFLLDAMVEAGQERIGDLLAMEGAGE